MYWLLFIVTVLGPGSYDIEAARIERKATCMELAGAINAVGVRYATCEPRVDG